MRRRGSLATPLLLALVLYSAWSPSAFVASPPPRPRRAVSLGAAGDDEHAALRNLLLSDISSASVKTPTKEKAAAPAEVKEAAPAKKAAPAAKAKAAAPAKKAEKAPAPKAKAAAPAKKAAEKVPAEVAKAPAEKQGVLSRDEHGTWRFKSDAASEPPHQDAGRVLTKNDQGLWRFVEVDRDTELLAAFKSFDLNGDGELDREELKEAAAKFGESEKQIEELLKQFDEKGNGTIGFDQFKKLIISAEEACDVEQEECFSLRNPSTWGLLFRRKRK